MPANLTEALDNLYTTTWQHMKGDAVDQIYEATPFWFWMKNNGRLKTTEGGKFIMEPVRYAKSDRVQFIGRGGTMPLDEEEFLTETIWQWRYLADSIVRFGVDDQKNRGKMAIMGLANSKLENSKDSLVDKIESSLFDASPASNAFNSLQVLVQEDPTSSEDIGGINQNTYSWWRNQSTNMTGLSFQLQGHQKMRNLLNTCAKNKAQEYPDLIVTDQTQYEKYENSLDERQRSTDTSLADAGFDNVKFKGRPLVWSPSAPSQKMYFLNTKRFWFVYDPAMNFDMTEWKPIPDQVNDRAAQIILAGNLVCNSRRVHGVLYNMDTE